MSGLHWFLSDDPQLADLAKRNNVTLWDVRKHAGRPSDSDLQSR